MRRFLLPLLALLLPLAACDGGSVSARFDFNGTWEIDIQGVRNTYPDGDDAAAWSSVLVIDQDGKQIDLELGSSHFEGTCDPHDGTFEAEYRHPDQVITLEGTFADDEVTLRGTYFDQSLKNDDHHFEATWTARLQ